MSTGELATIVGTVVAGTAWLTGLIWKVRLAVEERIQQHEQRCSGYDPHTGKLPLPPPGGGQ